MLELILWGAIGILGYIYFGYPLLIILLGRVFRQRDAHSREPAPEAAPAAALPSITVIITAYNEAKHIAEKIRNIFALDYPHDRLDIIVASDASSDATDEIVRQCTSEKVRLLRVEGRQGKTACQNAAANAASGDVLVFTDATTTLGSDALQAIALRFRDPEVGCVAGRLTYISRQDDATGKGGTSYWGYETALRVAESSLGSLIGVSGCLYGVRRSAYRDIRPDLISDFVIAMVMREQDLRTVLEPAATCTEETLDRADRELAMRIRVTLRSLVALATQRRFLNPLRFGTFAWQLWSHKLLRYLSPVFWLCALAANIALASRGEYVLLLALQVLALSAGLLGFLQLPVLGKSRLLAQPYYFVLTNVASAISLVKFIRREKVVTWTPLR
ncbi:glycosyltransferase family 2 protein [Lysobacter sp. D1-1-M9]|uniref:glycosyltransferase family 2 protein n=2 Tax=Novilysobacter TaxID=3382699 RepID=UPI002FCC1C5F